MMRRDQSSNGRPGARSLPSLSLGERANPSGPGVPLQLERLSR